jgi:hypothetical protein
LYHKIKSSDSPEKSPQLSKKKFGEEIKENAVNAEARRIFIIIIYFLGHKE